MQVRFTRTGERRYGVFIERDDGTRLAMHPAPGYDAAIPHDLAHFVVERECAIAHGVFGQVAAGGTAGTFHPADGAVDRRLRRRADRLLRAHEADMVRSERLAQAAFGVWRTNQRPAPDALERVCARFDELSARWRALGVGESLTLEW